MTNRVKPVIAVITEGDQALAHALTAAQLPLESILLAGLTEDALLAKLQNGEYQIVLAPLSIYLKWNRIHEWMKNKNQTWIGYPIGQHAVHQTKYPTTQPNSSKWIVLDLLNMSNEDLKRTFGLLFPKLDPPRLPTWLAPGTLIYCENWYSSQGLANRIDLILNLPQISQTHWKNREQSLKLLISSLFGLVFEGQQTKHPEKERQAYFQIGVDPNLVLVRLRFKGELQKFWPNGESNHHPEQVILKNSDWICLLYDKDSKDLDLVIGLNKNSTSFPGFWMQEVSAVWMQDNSSEVPGPQTPYLRALPVAPGQSPRPTLVSSTDARTGAPEQTLKDPDGDIEAFQKKYNDSKLQIRKFEVEYEKLKKQGGSREEMRELKLKMEAVQNRQKSWIKKLADIIKKLKESTRKMRR